MTKLIFLSFLSLAPILARDRLRAWIAPPITPPQEEEEEERKERWAWVKEWRSKIRLSSKSRTRTSERERERERTRVTLKSLVREKKDLYEAEEEVQRLL